MRKFQVMKSVTAKVASNDAGRNHLTICESNYNSASEISS